MSRRLATLLLACALAGGCSSPTSIKIVIDAAADVPALASLEVKILGKKTVTVDLTGKKLPGEILIKDIPDTKETRVVVNGLDAGKALVAQATVSVMPVMGQTVITAAHLTKGTLPDGDL